MSPPSHARDEDLGAGVAERMRAFVVLAHERPYRVPLFEQHVDHGPAHTTDLADGTGDQDGMRSGIKTSSVWRKWGGVAGWKARAAAVRQPASRFILRICLSKIPAGARRRSTRARPARGPAV